MRELLEQYPARDAALIWIYYRRILADEQGQSAEAALRADPLPIIQETLRAGWSQRQDDEIYTSGAIRTDGLLGRSLEHGSDELYARCLNRGMYREMRRLGVSRLTQVRSTLISHRTTARCLRHAIRRNLRILSPAVVGDISPSLKDELAETAPPGLRPMKIAHPAIPWTAESVQLPHADLHQRHDPSWQSTTWSLDPATFAGLDHGKWNGESLVLYADRRRPRRQLRVKPGRVYTVHGDRVCNYHLLTAQAQHLLSLFPRTRAKNAQSAP